jgi:hypothetical protein
MTITRPLLAAAIIAAALPAAAGAAPRSTGLRSAKFDLTLTGSQSTVWHYEHVANPDDGCDAGSKGDGSQLIRYSTPRPLGIEVYQAKPSSSLLGAFGPRPHVSPPVGDSLRLKASAEREADYKVDFGAVDPSRCPAQGSGDGDGGAPAPLPDCGKRTGTIDLELDFAKKDQLALTGTDPAFPSEGLESAYTLCEIEIGGPHGPEANGELLRGAARTAEAKLFDKRRRKVTVHASGVFPYAYGEATGKTIVTYNLTLKRKR